MTRKSFYKEYYRRTDSAFNDEITLSKHSGISKFGRKIYIILQHLSLVFGIAFTCDTKDATYIFLGGFLYLLCGLISDFSLVRMEILYHIYNRDTAYSEILYIFFLGEDTPLLDSLTRATKRFVRGYSPSCFGRIFRSVSALCKSTDDMLKIIFRPNSVKIRLNGESTVIDKDFETQEQLILEIASVVNSKSQVE